jgi:hypothetical protein
MAWKQKVPILADSAESGPTKPSKPGSVGFEGATSGESPRIEAEPEPVELARASAVLHHAGVRLMQVESVTTIGVWSDLDGPDVRKALRVLGSNRPPILYLDGVGVPMRYKLRRVEGEPVPMNVLIEMERQTADPWNVRDRMLKEMRWLNKGNAQPGPTAAATVCHEQQAGLRQAGFAVTK